MQSGSADRVRGEWATADPLAVAQALLATVVKAGGSRHVVARTTLALLTSLVAGCGSAPASDYQDDEEELQVRLDAIRPCLKARISGEPQSGSKRAGRNVAEHVNLGCGPDAIRQALKHPQWSQRRGRKQQLQHVPCSRDGGQSTRGNWLGSGSTECPINEFYGIDLKCAEVQTCCTFPPCCNVSTGWSSTSITPIAPTATAPRQVRVHVSDAADEGSLKTALGLNDASDVFCSSARQTPAMCTAAADAAHPSVATTPVAPQEHGANVLLDVVDQQESACVDMRLIDLRSCVLHYLASARIPSFHLSAVAINGDLRRAHQQAGVHARSTLSVFRASARCDVVRRIASDSQGALTMEKRGYDVLIVSMDRSLVETMVALEPEQMIQDYG